MAEFVISEHGDADPPHAVLHTADRHADYSDGLRRKSLDDAVAAKHLIVVLNDLAFMDSAGLTVVIGCIRRFRDLGGMVIVVCARTTLSRLLHTTGFDGISQVAGGYDQAVELLRGYSP